MSIGKKKKKKIYIIKCIKKHAVSKMWAIITLLKMQHECKTPLKILESPLIHTEEEQILIIYPLTNVY